MDLMKLFKRKKKYIGPSFYEKKSIEEYEDIWGGKAKEASTKLIEMGDILTHSSLFFEEVRLEQTKSLNYEILMFKKAIEQKKKERENIKNHYEQYVSEEESNTDSSDLQKIDELKVELLDAEETQKDLEKLCSTLKISTDE